MHVRAPVYYAHEFPVAEVASVFQLAGATEVMLRCQGGVVIRGKYPASAQALGSLVREHASTLQSVHLGPDPGLVVPFDIDVRAQQEARERPRSLCHGHAPHGERGICAGCWRWAQAGAVILDEQIGRPFGLPASAALCVFSGGNGLHVWYRLDGVADALTRQILARPSARRALFDVQLSLAALEGNKRLRARLEALMTEEELGLGYDPFALLGAVFDCHPTLGRPLHPVTQEGLQSPTTLRAPFSLHESGPGRIAVPLTCRVAGDMGTLPLPTAVRANATPAEQREELDSGRRALRQWASC